MAEQDTVRAVIERLRARGRTDSVRDDADELLRGLEPVARRAARNAAGGVPEDVLEDLVQQTLEIAWRKLPGFDPDGAAPLEAWVSGIARRVVGNDRRKKREFLTEDGLVDANDATGSVLAALQREERDQLVIDAIAAALEGVEQDVLYHRYVHGLEREHVAELLGLSGADEVRVVLQRAQRRLRAELNRRLEAIRHGRSYLGTLDG